VGFSVNTERYLVKIPWSSVFATSSCVRLLNKFDLNGYDHLHYLFLRAKGLDGVFISKVKNSLIKYPIQ
jgi:hypothetical protein